MTNGRAGSRLAAIALALALLAPAGIARGQALPAPPQTKADENASIIRPLAEIGRVRSRTPYCAALARARPGIDSALAYEYAVPLVAQDLRSFRFDSELTKARAAKKTERDINALFDLAIAGRAQVVALRDAAKSDGIDEQRRKAMLEFANAVDGAKTRQMNLARAISRVYGELAERPAHTVANTAKDDVGANAFDRTGGVRNLAALEPIPATNTQSQADAIDEHERLQLLFGTFEAERFIRDDLKTASQLATSAMQLGGCATPP